MLFGVVQDVAPHALIGALGEYLIGQHLDRLDSHLFNGGVEQHLVITTAMVDPLRIQRYANMNTYLHVGNM